MQWRAFHAFEDNWEYRDGNPVRTLLSGKLIDVAPVTVPAYGTSAPGLRSLAKHMDARYEDVAQLAAQGELRRLFERTDRPVLRPETTMPWYVAHAHYGRVLHMHARRMAWH